MEMLRSDDPEFQRFGQVYVTMVYPGVVKAGTTTGCRPTTSCASAAWPRSCSTTPARARRPTGETNEFVIGWQRQTLVIIPPDVYHGFTAWATEPAYIVNIPTELYNYDDPDEHRLPLRRPAIGYDWGM